MEIKRLYEDEKLVVAVKPPRILSEDTESTAGMPTLLSSGAPLYTVHRLDKGTGGIMVYAKDSKTAALLTQAMQERTHFKKEYLVLTEGIPDAPSARLVDLLFHSREKNKTYVVERKRSGVKEAALTYRVLTESDGCALLHVVLETGRTHQIRAQLSSRKLPLVGDAKYGATRKDRDPALFAFRLTFCHPYTKKEMAFVHFPEEGALSAFDFSQWF